MAEISCHVLPEDRSKIDSYYNATLEPTSSVPDLQMGFGEPRSLIKPVIALEIAFAQDGDELEARARWLLQETTVRVVIAVHIKESPSYKNPFKKDEGVRISFDLVNPNITRKIWRQLRISMTARTPSTALY